MGKMRAQTLLQHDINNLTQKKHDINSKQTIESRQGRKKNNQKATTLSACLDPH